MPNKSRLKSVSSPNKKRRMNIDPKGSKKKGLMGLYETVLRKFKTAVFLITLFPIYLIGGAVLGLALAPGIAMFKFTLAHTSSWSSIWQNIALASTIGLAIFTTGACLLMIVPALNFLLRTNLKPYRGPYFSSNVVGWFVHNAFVYLIRYTFLEFITPTPFNILFFQAMGMKVGKGTHINSSNISDPSLIEIGKFVTVGGSVTICAHYGQGGFLVLAPVKIGDKVTLGLKSTIMGGVTIGDGATVMPNSAVLPKTVIGPGELWGGVPAKKISKKGVAKKKAA